MSFNLVKKKPLKIAVVCAAGIGDALNMMIASHALQQMGHFVTTFSDILHSFGPWLKNFQFQKHPSIEKMAETYLSFDAIVLQHENSPRAYQIYDLKQQGLHIFCFYNNYRKTKHPPIDPNFDFDFDESIPMAENVAKSMQKILQQKKLSKEIGMTPPDSVRYQAFSKRVVIHPTSSSTSKNWSKTKFCKLARKLQRKGYHPSFIMAPQERTNWLDLYDLGFDLPFLPTLYHTANYLYESSYFIGNDSGPGHLASYFHLPSIILAQFPQSISHWRPGWKEAKILLPSRWAPNLKGFRLREKNWQLFLSVSRVLKNFNYLTYSK